MVLKKISILLSIFWAALSVVQPNLLAQELPITQLKEVEIRDTRLSEFALGARTTILDSTIIISNKSNSLADLLNDYTTTHIKSQGNGMLASISFRGTGAQHTAVLWHGINISYPMLGQTDFSLLSVALVDQLIIQHGTGSSLYGSGALGGTISLGSTRPVEGLNIDITQWVGSFTTIKNNANISWSTGRYFIKVSTSWNKSDNDFSYNNTSIPGSPAEKQNNAAYEQFGLAIETGLKVGERSEILVSGQLQDMYRQVQPSIVVNDATDYQEDNNLRVRTRYQFNGLKTDWYFQYAYLKDQINYNGDVTNSYQHVIRGNIDQQFSNKIKASFAVDHTMVNVKAQFYEGQDVSETRSNLWASILANPISRLMISANLRQGFHPIYTVPLSPSIGTEFILKETAFKRHQVSMMAARGFRIPTLNELYWAPGGNLNLEPEDSYSIELGFKGHSGEQLSLDYDISVYRMWVSNWILWRPNGSFWSPENIKEVDVYGIEVSGGLHHAVGSLKLSWQGHYAYTKSINRTGLDQFDRSVGKQLSYTPIHKGGLTVSARLNSWMLLINSAAIGKRYTTSDNENYLPAYALLNVRASKEIDLGAYGLGLFASINNVLNTSYQSVVNKAMPGINYLLGINIKFNNQQL